MTLAIVGRIGVQALAELVMCARLKEETAGVEARTLNRMVGGLSDCLVRLDSRLHLCGSPQKLPQLLRSLSSSSSHWEQVNFLKYVTDDDKERFRAFINSSDARTPTGKESSNIADALHVTLMHQGVRVAVQLFHARIHSSLKTDAHLLAFKDLSKEQEAMDAAADTVFDLVPRTSAVAPMKSLASQSISSGQGSSKGSRRSRSKQPKKPEEPAVNLMMQLSAEPAGVNLRKYEVKLTAKDKEGLGVRLERFVTPSHWLNLKATLDAKLDLTQPDVGISIYENPISFNLPLLGAVGVNQHNLRIFIPDAPQDGTPTQVTLIAEIIQSIKLRERQEHERRRHELQSRASDASDDEPVCTVERADPFPTEEGLGKVAL
eukprot:TRINITY_DN41859_c2_g1_i2.p1 TRINITY_DN41859_c2_g1~~TRINITY_DN41859_c2_g1_i2.p1  ORF type:complete len:376 (-),score=74.77 TRINITY_DN41859_c2_g1_i2:186-1313(-)